LIPLMRSLGLQDPSDITYIHNNDLQGQGIDSSTYFKLRRVCSFAIQICGAANKTFNLLDRKACEVCGLANIRRQCPTCVNRGLRIRLCSVKCGEHHWFHTHSTNFDTTSSSNSLSFASLSDTTLIIPSTSHPMV
jgi:hypothetical protein